MCLYHYLYFSACQHGELTLITYCDEAKALSLATTYVRMVTCSTLLTTFRDSPSRHNIQTACDQSLTPLSTPSATNHSASHSPNQQYHSMETISPSKVRTLPGCGPTPVHREHLSSRHAAFVPRSALLKPVSNSTSLTSPSSSISTAQDVQVLNSNNTYDGALMLSTEVFCQGTHTLSQSCDLVRLH